MARQRRRRRREVDVPWWRSIPGMLLVLFGGLLLMLGFASLVLQVAFVPEAADRVPLSKWLAQLGTAVTGGLIGCGGLAVRRGTWGMAVVLLAAGFGLGFYSSEELNRHNRSSNPYGAASASSVGSADSADDADAEEEAARSAGH